MENKTSIMAEYDDKKGLYQSFTSEVEHQLINILQAERIVYNAITSRLKDRDSLSEKIDRKEDKYLHLGDLTDIAGVRVITYYSEDVDKIAEIVESEFKIDYDNSIDKRDALEPDRFGYCSVHYVVEMSPARLKLREHRAYKGLKCEIQIRSVLQHAWAEIEHDLGYKSEIAIPKDIRRNFSRLAGLLEIADKEFQEIRSFLQSYQNEAMGKMEREELQDAEIDAIILETMIKTDKDIIKINDQIAEIFGKNHEEIVTTEHYEHAISYLHWFDVYTVGQLQDFISRNEEGAVKVAKEFLTGIGKESGRNAKISKTIVFMYLCYAEIVSNNYDQEEIMKYFKEVHLGKGDEAKKDVAQRLLNMRKEWKE